MELAAYLAEAGHKREMAEALGEAARLGGRGRRRNGLVAVSGVGC